MTEVATETTETKVAEEVVKDTPAAETRAALQETAKKHGINLPEAEDNEVVESVKSDQEDKPSKETPKEDKSTLELTDKHKTTARYMKLDEATLEAMGQDKATELLERLTKVREDTARAMAGKGKKAKTEPEPEEVVEPVEPEVDADDPAAQLATEFSEELWGDAATPMNAMRKMILKLSETVSGQASAQETLAIESAKLTVEKFIEDLPDSVSKPYDDQATLDLLVEKASDLRESSLRRGEPMSEVQALEEAHAIVARRVIEKASETRGVRKARHESRVPRPSTDGRAPLGPAASTLDELQATAAKWGVRLPHNAES